jgi:YcaO-like protein with predicted kinase domain
MAHVGLPTAEVDGRGLKQYTLGTHRVCDPEDTLARLTPHLGTMGITRIANVTGLDRVGIPVVTVVRPNARTGAVSQGKGLTLAAAKASGVMEAAELWHAENIVKPLRFASFDEMRSEHRVADPDRLPRVAGSCYKPSLSLLWIEGADLLGGGPVWVPFELVSANYTLPGPPGSGCFQATTNGLASGNHQLEAICHGLCEVLERDATTLWSTSGDAAGRGVDPSSITNPECLSVIDRLTAADLAVRIWDTTSDVGVASFCCLVMEKYGEFADPEQGMGCHPVREIALLRALTEAAQVRVTYISGAREDFTPDAWEPSARRRHRDALVGNADSVVAPSACFDTVPTFIASSLADDLEWILARLRAVGIDQVLAVDLGRDTLGIPVVRIVVPGLEGPNDESLGYTPGARARRLMGLS